jgi:hypothetical protein
MANHEHPSTKHHLKAAEQHTKAAEHHHLAARHHEAGDHNLANEHSAQANDHSTQAHQHSTDAYRESLAMSNPKNQHKSGGAQPIGSFQPDAGKSPASRDYSHEQHQQGEHGPTRGQGQKH